MRVLLIEDNAEVAGLIAEGLNRRAISVDAVGELRAADEFLAATDFDVIVLDLGLPDGDGVDWLARLPRERPPVLILSARTTLRDRIKGLDTGADDYLTKPAEIDEIAARLRALVRRPGSREPVVLAAGPVSLDPASREVSVHGDAVRFGRKETDFLEILIRRKGRVVAREAIEAVLYGVSEPVTPNAMEALASRVRRRLADAGAHDLLHTIRGVGYVLGETER